MLKMGVKIQKKGKIKPTIGVMSKSSAKILCDLGFGLLFQIVSTSYGFYSSGSQGCQAYLRMPVQIKMTFMDLMHI